MKSFQLTALFFAAIATAVSTSCSTTKGFGQDLQKVGNRLENQADATGGTAPATAPSTGITMPPAAPTGMSAY
jgi:predicted small secreted protein